MSTLFFKSEKAFEQIVHLPSLECSFICSFNKMPWNATILVSFKAKDALVDIDVWHEVTEEYFPRELLQEELTSMLFKMLAENLNPIFLHVEVVGLHNTPDRRLVQLITEMGDKNVQRIEG